LIETKLDFDNIQVLDIKINKSVLLFIFFILSIEFFSASIFSGFSIFSILILETTFQADVNLVSNPNIFCSSFIIFILFFCIVTFSLTLLEFNFLLAVVNSFFSSFNFFNSSFNSLYFFILDFSFCDSTKTIWAFNLAISASNFAINNSLLGIFIKFILVFKFTNALIALFIDFFFSSKLSVCFVIISSHDL